MTDKELTTLEKLEEECNQWAGLYAAEAESTADMRGKITKLQSDNDALRQEVKRLTHLLDGYVEAQR